MKVLELGDVTRITIVDSIGIIFEDYSVYDNGAELHLQDNGRTLKIFPRQEKNEQL